MPSINSNAVRKLISPIRGFTSHVVDQPLRSEVVIGASTDTDLATVESGEFLHRVNSTELAQPLHAKQEQSEKQIPTLYSLKKYFTEVVSSLVGNRSLHQLSSGLRKYFLTDHTPQPLSVKSVNQGCPTLSFVDVEIKELAAPYRFSLVGKFSHGAPLYSLMHQLITRLGIQGTFIVSMVNAKHTLISLSSESDYPCLWLRRIWFLQDFPMRIFKWTPTFTPTQESSVALIWVCFPELPAHLFRNETLFSVASMVGSPLQIDALTLNKSKLSQVRVCVEIDLLKPIIEDFDLHINGVTIIQKVMFEKLPEYCSLCKHVGHKDSDCFSKGNAPKPLPRNKIISRHEQFVGIGMKQARDKGQKVIESVSRPVASNFERSKVEAEYSKDNYPKKRELMNKDWEARKNIDSNSKITFHNKKEFIKMAICFVELTTGIEWGFNVTTKCPRIARLTRGVGLRISLAPMKPTPKGRSGTFQVEDLEIGHRGSYGDLH
ncbi:UNVERIFIED_CONTAM: hypothetical protein Scaly_2439000 [Sesamum calycinum]|uniref:DUF4283 domain-containing protein n=1 Tax=Sesamum calycinum TaxID=2727403 RepID=A0AAW2LZZ3_9LAMI